MLTKADEIELADDSVFIRIHTLKFEVYFDWKLVDAQCFVGGKFGEEPIESLSQYRSHCHTFGSKKKCVPLMLLYGINCEYCNAVAMVCFDSCAY